jgi:hypothetical protein
MRPFTSRILAPLLALTLLAAIPAACTDSSLNSPVIRATVSHDAAADAPVEAAPEAPPAIVRCCQMLPADGGNCGAILQKQISEPCWGADTGTEYAAWTCGADAGICADNGASCTIGGACFLTDLGCAGVVVDCAASSPPS